MAKKANSKNQNKTVATNVRWQDYLKNGKFSDQEKKDAEILVKIFENVTKSKCVMWGAIFGFGTYHYKGKSREGDWMAGGFVCANLA